MAKYRLNSRVKFVNPYHFIKLSKGVPLRGESDKKGALTGKLHCKLVTKTPLAILDTESVEYDQNDHPTFRFYSVGGEKAIPGSSIRGCIRSVYETLTDSCFVTMPENEFITSRVDMKSREIYNPGLLIFENGKWQLYSAKRIWIRTETRKGEGVKTRYYEKISGKSGERYITDGKEEFFYGDCVAVETQSVTVSGATKREEIRKMSRSKDGNCYVFVGEPMRKRKVYQSVFRKLERQKNISQEVIDKALFGLKCVVDIYQNESVNREFSKGASPEKHHGYLGFSRCEKKHAVLPVWYLRSDKGELSLSMAAIGRKVYKSTVNEMIGTKRIPCSKRNSLCPACELFGMAKGDAKGSRVRITDARIVNEVSSKLVTLQELGSPRIGYYLFYSENGKQYDEEGAMIAGRKFYWHNPMVNSDNKVYSTTEKNKRNATVEVLKDAEFEFDVYYENITEQQLNEIEWVLTLGENQSDGFMCHKIGHGKPLGLGSVKIVIESNQHREYVDGNYSVETDSNVVIDENSFRDDDARKAIAVACNLNTMSDRRVCYPFIECSGADKEKLRKNSNALAAHQWFTQNRRDSQKLTDVGNPQRTLSAYSASEM